MVHALLKAICVTHGDSRSGVMSYHVPLRDALFHTQLFDPVREGFQLLRPVGHLRRLPQTRQVHSEAGKLPAQLVYNARPELAAGRHAVYEQHRITCSARTQIHAVLPLPPDRLNSLIRPPSATACNIQKRSKRQPARNPEPNRASKSSKFPAASTARTPNSCSRPAWCTPCRKMALQCGF